MRIPGYVPPVEVSESDIEIGLAALDEAGEFFAGSLKLTDTFRLVAIRIRTVLPFKSIVLFLLDETRTQLRVAETEGIETRPDKFDDGLARQCYSSRHIEIDGYMSLDATHGFSSSVAIPLYHGTEVFGVLQLYFDADFDMVNADRSLFEAVGTRVAPGVLASIAFERSQTNALTDVTTDLPNERAFYLILENRWTFWPGRSGMRSLLSCRPHREIFRTRSLQGFTLDFWAES